MPLPTAWDVQTAIGKPRAIIRVRNLQTTLGPQAAQDAWGRNGRSQPALISAEVVLRSPFPEAADTDSVAGDTVHYGSLSKAILKSVARWDDDKSQQPPPPRPSPEWRTPTLQTVLDCIWADLSGHSVSANDGIVQETTVTDQPKALLTTGVARSLSVTVHLPKATLTGEGVSFTAAGILDPIPLQKDLAGAGLGANTLKLHRLRIPTLVGVHPHERTAKQAVVADITLDRIDGVEDFYAPLEAFVVNIMEASSFETLEALATHIARKILLEFRPNDLYEGKEAPWYVHVALEKPIAVPSADAPVVEVRMEAADLGE